MTNEDFNDKMFLAFRTKYWFGFTKWQRLCELPPGKETSICAWALALKHYGTDVFWRVENRGGRPQRGYGFE